MTLKHALKHSLSIITALLFMTVVAFGQSVETLTFEVATVKPSAWDVMKLAAQVQTGQMPAIGAHVNKIRAEYTFMTVKELIATAYGLKQFQITGPDWINDIAQRFDIVAKMPDGSTVE